jgi:hypothetical protein
MSQEQLMVDLISDGERVLRTTAPHDRERQWRSWQKKVTGIMDKIPEMKTLGIQLKSESLASDVGIISRFTRLISNQGQLNQERDKVTDKKVKIFVSHKHEDERTARGVKSAIERYGAGLVEVFLSEDIPKGANWIVGSVIGYLRQTCCCCFSPMRVVVGIGVCMKRVFSLN